ncbi:MAG: STAS domain-containing protein [Puniceicoccales bacterium]|nr:STAS domain-containing protein [Puniceicoccales bacterium]
MKIRLPLVSELGGYTRPKFKADVFAGATLAFVAVPQCVGFALVLGVPPGAVMLAAVIGGLAGAVFFSSHHHIFGPTGSATLIASATVAATVAAGSPFSVVGLLAVLALLVGAAQLAAGMLRFGEVTKFISRSVIVAYSAAIGLILAAGQLRWFFEDGAVGGSGGFSGAVAGAARAAAAGKVAWGDCGVAAFALGLFALVHKWRPRWPEYLIGLGAAWFAARLLGQHAAGGGAVLPFRLLRDSTGMAGGAGGTPEFLPEVARVLGDLPPDLLGGAAAIAIVGMLEASAITKTLASKSGQAGVDPNQELLGMGAGNVLCGLLGAVPGASSFSRSAVNYESGARTQFSGAFAALAVLAVLLFLAPFLGDIPVAALAALLMRVGWRMIIPAQIRVACRSTRSDAAVFAVTLAAALLVRLDIAIYAGIGLSLALFLQKTSLPILVEYAFDESGALAQVSESNKRTNPQVAIIHVEGELFFGAADVFLTQVRQQADSENIRIFILRLKNARHLDASTVMALDALHGYLGRKNRYLLISGCSDDVLGVLRNSGVARVLGAENIFAAQPANPNLSTRQALLRARQLLESDTADIRIFYDKRREKKGLSPTAEYVANYQI